MDGPDVGTSLTWRPVACPAGAGGVISFSFLIMASRACECSTWRDRGDAFLQDSMGTDVGPMADMADIGSASSLPYCVSGVLGVSGASSSSELLPLK